MEHLLIFLTLSRATKLWCQHRGRKITIYYTLFIFISLTATFFCLFRTTIFSQVTSDVVSKFKQRDAGVSGENTFRWHISCMQGALIKDGGR